MSSDLMIYLYGNAHPDSFTVVWGTLFSTFWAPVLVPSYLLQCLLLGFGANFRISDLPAYHSALVFGPVVWGLPFFLFRRYNAAQQQAAQKRREKTEEERRQTEYDRNQAAIRGTLVSLSSGATAALRSIPSAITSANRALDKAEAEYAEGVFAPFWDAVEQALASLMQYDAHVRVITENTTRFADTSKMCAFQPPAFVPDDSDIPDVTAVVKRLRTIVRKAQKVPDFAKIYEMRRTNSLLVAGFANLGSAIENMGDRIHDSINGLAQTFDSAISSMSQHNAEYHRESLSAIETMRNQLASNAEEQRKHEENVEGMLDNIQRRKRPWVAKFRDGQY